MNPRAYVLCGGASRRMGRCKATHLFQGERLMDRMARLAHEAGYSPHFVVKKHQKFSSEEYPIVIEDPSDHHPLFGVAKALEHCDGDFALILPCDTPLLSSSRLRRFSSCHQTTIAVNKRRHPLIGWYSTEWAARAFLAAQNHLSVNQFAQQALSLYFPAIELHNCNHPEDL